MRSSSSPGLRRFRPTFGRKRLTHWHECRAQLEKVRGRWIDREQSDRAIELLLTVDGFLKITLRVDDAVYETSALDVGKRKQDENIVRAFSEVGESEPAGARRIVLSKFRYLRKHAARGYQAIRNIPGFDDMHRREAAALFSHALEPRALTCGVGKVSAGAVRLDARAVERIAPFLSPEHCAEPCPFGKRA